MITVTFNARELRGFGADVHAGIHMLQALEKAGIPVLGTLLPMGVSEGTLSMRADSTADTVVYEWDGEESLA